MSPPSSAHRVRRPSHRSGIEPGSQNLNFSLKETKICLLALGIFLANFEKPFLGKFSQGVGPDRSMPTERRQEITMEAAAAPTLGGALRRPCAAATAASKVAAEQNAARRRWRERLRQRGHPVALAAEHSAAELLDTRGA